MRIPVGNSLCFYEVAYITDPAFAERSEKHLELASVYKKYIYIYRCKYTNTFCCTTLPEEIEPSTIAKPRRMQVACRNCFGRDTESLSPQLHGLGLSV